MTEIVSQFDAEILVTERALIGGVLLDRCRTLPPLLPSEFMGDRHAQLWTVILECADGTDALVLRAELAKRDRLEAAGGPAYLAECLEEGATVVPSGLARYAALVREACRQRMIRRLGVEMAAKGIEPVEIERRLAELPGSLTSVEPWVASRVLEDYARHLRESPRLMTGLSAVDAAIGGFLTGEIVAVGGRTSHGKTAFVLHLAIQVAAGGSRVTLLSLEETREVVTLRLLAARSGITYKRLAYAAHTLSELERAHVDRAAAWLDTLSGILDVISVQTLRSLDEDTVCGAVAASKASLVIVDHLQKIRTAGDSRVYGLENVMNRLHASALRDSRSVVVACQLNREMDFHRRPPQLSDLRDSGGVEILAKKVLLLYWPFKHDEKRDRGEYVVDVAKQSVGGSETVKIRWDAATGRFWGQPEEELGS